MTKKSRSLMMNNLCGEIRSLAFLSGKTELYSELGNLDTSLDRDFPTGFGRLGDVNSDNDVGFRWRSQNRDWKRALRLRREMKSLGYVLKIQRQYSIPAKTEDRVVWKKYRGLNWDKFGSPDYSVIYFEVPGLVVADARVKE